MKNKKVLLIEGHSDTSEKLVPLLEEQMCIVTVAKNSLEGIKNIYSQKPDFVFLDFSIHDISNYQVYKFLKNNYDLRDIPVVIAEKSKKEIFILFGVIKDSSISYLDITQSTDAIRQEIKDILVRHEQSFIVSQNFKLIKELNKNVRNLLSQYEDKDNVNIEEINSLLEEIVHKFSSIMSSEISSLMILDEESKHLYIKAAKGLKDEIIYETKVKVGEGIAGWVVNGEHPVLVADIEKDSRFFKVNDEKYYTKSFLSAPLRFGRLKGVINLNNKSTKESYNERDLALLNMLINQLNFSLENSDLFMKIQTKEKELQEIKTDKKILSDLNKLLDKELYENVVSCEVNKILCQELDYKQTIKTIIELIESGLDYHFLGLLLLDGLKEAELIVSIKYPASEYNLAAFKSKVLDTYHQITDCGPIGRVSLNKTGDTDILGSNNKSDKDILSSFYAVPLNMKNKNLGLLAISHSIPGAFTSKEQKLLYIIADHSALAIGNAVLHKKIKELSVTDGLTGLYVYRHFQNKLNEELRRAQRYQKSLSLVMMDIDGFKAINDTYGHLAGNKILKELAQILIKVYREVDVIVRYGGEEFAIILPETDREGAFYVAERARKEIKNYDFFLSRDERPIKITVSCGVASYPESAKENEALIKNADDALYKAKNEGKNKTSLYQF